MSLSARTSSTLTNRSTKKSSDSFRPHYYTTFQNSCCGSKVDTPPPPPSSSSTQVKDILPIPTKFKNTAEKLLTAINEILVEDLPRIASYTSLIPSIFFETNDNFQIQKYLIDRVMLRTLDDAEIINWNIRLKKLYPIRTSGNGNCLLHAVLIAMIGIHDNDLYLRDRLAQFMNDNKDLLKTHWRIERLKSDKSYGISTEDSKLDDEWKELCDLVHYKNSEDGQAVTHLDFLEAVHIFSVSNMLRRPIIVLSEDVIRNKNGEAISVNDLYGIYLPILSSPTECINEPIVLAYDRSHFCPLQINDTNREKILDNLLPLYPSVNHIPERTLLPIRFLGDDITVERSNNLLREYLRIKEIDYTVDSSSSPMSILCAELGTKYLASIDNFFLLYYDYVNDFFKIQKPKAIEEEQKRELDEYMARHNSYDIYDRSATRYDTSLTRPLRSNDTQYSRSYDLHDYSDDIRSSGAYIPRNGPSYFENSTIQPQQSQRSLESATRQPSSTSNSDIISNLPDNGKIRNSVQIHIDETNSNLNKERQPSSVVHIPVQILKPSASSNNQNSTIYDQRRDPLDLCLLCDQPLDTRKLSGICSICDYKIHNPGLYNDVSSRPTRRSRSTNMYLPTSDRGYTSPLSPIPKTRPANRILCPHCKHLNLSHNLTRNTDFRCSVCLNSIPSAYL